jgi:hypothetical protein
MVGNEPLPSVADSSGEVIWFVGAAHDGWEAFWPEMAASDDLGLRNGR